MEKPVKLSGARALRKEYSVSKMEREMEEALFNQDIEFRDPEPVRTGIIHEPGTAEEIVAYYKKQQPPLFACNHLITRPKLVFEDPFYIVQEISLTISPFWDELGNYPFPHNNRLKQTMPEQCYTEIKEMGQYPDGDLTSAYLVFLEKVGVMAKTKGRPLLDLQGEEFNWHINLLVSQVNGTADGIYEVMRRLKITYSPWIAGGECAFSQYERQQSERNLGKVPRTKAERNWWSSSVTDKKLERILAGKDLE